MENKNPENSLLFYESNDSKLLKSDNENTMPRKPFMQIETPGMCWSLRDKARWDYKHGLFIENKIKIKNKNKSNYLNLIDTVSRISISFRQFRINAKIPIYDPKNNI